MGKANMRKRNYSVLVNSTNTHNEKAHKYQHTCQTLQAKYVQAVIRQAWYPLSFST